MAVGASRARRVGMRGDGTVERTCVDDVGFLDAEETRRGRDEKLRRRTGGTFAASRGSRALPENVTSWESIQME